jgi:hypothetical protein
MSGPQSLGPGPRAADCQRSYLLRTPSQNRIGCAGAHVRPAVFGAGSMSRRLSALVHFAGALTDYDWMRWGSCQAQSLWGPFRGPQTWAADCQLWYTLRTPSQIMIGCAGAHVRPTFLGTGSEGCRLSALVHFADALTDLIGCAGAHVRPAIFGPCSAGRSLSALVHFVDALTDHDWMRWEPCQAHSLWALFRGPQTVSAGHIEVYGALWRLMEFFGYVCLYC